MFQYCWWNHLVFLVSETRYGIHFFFANIFILTLELLQTYGINTYSNKLSFLAFPFSNINYPITSSFHNYDFDPLFVMAYDLFPDCSVNAMFRIFSDPSRMILPFCLGWTPHVPSFIHLLASWSPSHCPADPHRGRGKGCPIIQTSAPTLH